MGSFGADTALLYFLGSVIVERYISALKNSNNYPIACMAMKYQTDRPTVMDYQRI